MTKSYCVREKIKTNSVPNSEKYMRTKNNRLILKSKCVSCGITKTRFVSEKKGRGVGETINKKVGEKIPGFQQAQDLASAIMAVTGGDKDLFKKYWRGDFAKGIFNKKSGIQTSNFWKPAGAYTNEKFNPSCNYTEYKNGKWVNHYCD